MAVELDYYKKSEIDALNIPTLANNVASLEDDVENHESRIGVNETAIALLKVKDEEFRGRFETDESRISNVETNKQPTLVSGSNIKTINSVSILGSGNLVISGSDAVLYRHCVYLEGEGTYSSGTRLKGFTLCFDIVSSQQTEMTKNDLIVYFNVKGSAVACSGQFNNGTSSQTSQYNAIRISRKDGFKGIYGTSVSNTYSHSIQEFLVDSNITNIEDIVSQLS